MQSELENIGFGVLERLDEKITYLTADIELLMTKITMLEFKMDEMSNPNNSFVKGYLDEFEKQYS